MDMTPVSSEFALSSLETLRKRLLDLSARNRLLNFTHARSGCIRCVDERPDQLHSLLLSEEELRFLAVPHPTRAQLLEAGYLQVDKQTGTDIAIKKAPSAAEWAVCLGIHCEFELPLETSPETARHQDRCIQTLLYPEELETQLRNLRNKAETAIEETGANILFLAFGFLEWFETAEAQIPRLAPLYLVPVRLNRGRLDARTGTYSYTLNYTGEDIVPNLSLREKLRVDFQLALPELSEDVLPEQYFADVQAMVAQHQPHWKVRRFATLALLNFGRLLMYLDLDPDRWPQDERHITRHPVVQKFFASSSQSSAEMTTAQEHSIDELPNVHERYPLIDDADSSQHSAMIDALDGLNLVIEGPPGTGKSQTITNLIAAALARNKKVLFVAEKLAALEVVKNRLDRAGLGDFCLELHSHKTQKRKVLDDISARLLRQSQYRHPQEIEADIERYEQLKDQLRVHAERVNEIWCESGRTVHDILFAAAHLRERFQVNPQTLHPGVLAADELTAERQRALRDQFASFVALFSSVAKQLPNGKGLAGHPWYGLSNPDLQFSDRESVVRLLQQWQDALLVLKALCTRVTESFELPASSLDRLEAAESLLMDLDRLPPLHGDEHLAALSLLQGENLRLFQHWLKDYAHYQGSLPQLITIFQPAALDSAEGGEAMAGALNHFRALGVEDASDTRLITSYIRQIDDLVARLQSLVPRLEEMGSAIGPAFARHICLSLTGLKQLDLVLQSVASLQPSLWPHRSELFDNDDLDRLLPLLKEEKERLSALKLQVERTFKIDKATDLNLLRKCLTVLSNKSLLRWFNLEWWRARKLVRSLAVQDDPSDSELVRQLPALIIYMEGLDRFAEDARYRSALQSHFQALDTNLEDLFALRAFYRELTRSFGVGLGPRVDLGQAVLAMPSAVAKGIHVLMEQGMKEQVSAAITELNALKRFVPAYSPLQSDDAQLLPVHAVSPLEQLREQLITAMSPLEQHVRLMQWSIEEVANWLSRLQDFHQTRQRITESDLDQRLFKGALGLKLNPAKDETAAFEAAVHTEQLARVLEENVTFLPLAQSIRKDPTKARFDAWANVRHELALALDAVKVQRIPFEEEAELDFDLWAGTDTGLSALIERNRRALSQPQWLASWTDYLRMRSTTLRLGAEGAVAALEQGSIPAEQAADALELGICDLLAREILKQDPHFAQFSGLAQEALQQQFRDYDEKLKKLQRERIAWHISRTPVPEGVVGGKVANYSELALLKHECGKKVRHLPIRQLVRRSGQALIALKPCFMMGPMAVAQYLAPGEIEFDLIVMDEASQVKPEDALGAIARARQVVIVGDPKQLPPTSFFDRAMAEEEDEEATAIEESESILEVAAPMFANRRLRWHYRSQHESLIAFSNQAFYQDLVVFPSPFNRSPDFGVKYQPVSDGCFVKRRNIVEARMIAAAIAEHVKSRPHESIGAVAMSSEQRDQIEKELETLAKADPPLEQALEDNRQQAEPLFIKNLENVQGDERDVILISCTYGPPEPGGRVAQRFGPINSGGGWRRLNVLFTRSKKRMEVFSSMGAEDIQVGETTGRGVRALRDFLAYARSTQEGMDSGASTGAGQDLKLTPSNLHVAQALGSALRSLGYSLASNVGVGGYQLDLAIRDPDDPGRFLLALETDGPQYRAAASVRDRDRLRQTVLKRLGWGLIRVWSLDWYKNPDAVMKSIQAELSLQESRVKAQN